MPTSPLEDLGRILIVDDDPQLLSGLSRNLRRLIPVETANGGEDALALLRRDKNFSIIMCDMRMPGMNGAEFFSKARLQLPDAVRILLTGQADLAAVISAINDGHIDRFLSKPVERDDLMRVIGAAMAHYRLKKDEVRQLEATRRLAVDWGHGVLSLASMAIYARASRIRRTVKLLAEQLGLSDALAIEMTAVLSVTAELVPAASSGVVSQALKGLAGNADNMQEVKLMIDELSAPADAPMRVGTRLVKVARQLDDEQGPFLERVDRLERNGHLDLRIASALRDLAGALAPTGRPMEVSKLEPGHRLLQPLRNAAGEVLVPEGVVVSGVMLATIASRGPVGEVHVVNDSETSPTPVPFSVSA
jgi:CheY-like chemotaxis protein